jgi:hypothetical protein
LSLLLVVLISIGFAFMSPLVHACSPGEPVSHATHDHAGDVDPSLPRHEVNCTLLARCIVAPAALQLTGSSLPRPAIVAGFGFVADPVLPSLAWRPPSPPPRLSLAPS